MKTQTRVAIMGNNLQLHLNENKLITFKGVTDTKQIPEYMISNLNYLIDSFFIDSQVFIKVEKEKFPFTGWYIYLESANSAFTYLRIYYRNDTRKTNIFGRVNGYILDNQTTQTYKQAVNNLHNHISSIF